MRIFMLVLALGVWTGSCGAETASAPAAAASAVAKASSVASAVRASAPSNSAGLKPFDEVIKDAKLHKSLFNLYVKEEKYWLEVNENQLGKPFLFSVNLSRGNGDSQLNGRRMLSAGIVEFRRIGNVMQLVELNPGLTAEDKSPLRYALRESFSTSLLASSAVLSLPHPERKSVLIELNKLLFSDLPMLSTALESRTRMTYLFDAANSSFSSWHTRKDMLGVEVNALYAVNRIPAATGNTSPPPATLALPDPRNMFVGLYYSFASLPEQVMRPRLADQRIGYFASPVWNFSAPVQEESRRYYIHRWRLEKKDPAAVLSEPKQPITYWLDRNIPHEYRDTVRSAILEWNKAFERIGFKDAIVVKQQENDALFKTDDVRHASVRWFLNSDRSGLAGVGPSIADPRSGEILDADISIAESALRTYSNLLRDGLKPVAADWADDAAYASQLGNDAAMAKELMSARQGKPLSAEEEKKVVLDALKALVIHEVGHTLGLRHNFRSSTIYSQAQLANPEFTHEHGLGGSVMDYLPLNLPLNGEKDADLSMTVLGPYDYWAIEYGYKTVPAEEEAAALEKIAARSIEPQLAFSTDEEAYYGNDPGSSTFDLGDDPIAFARRRVALTRELWERLQSQPVAQIEWNKRLYSSFSYSLSQAAEAGMNVARYIGGIEFTRHRSAEGRANYLPVKVERQRAALALMSDTFFAEQAFRIKPEFLAQLTPNLLVLGGGSHTAFNLGQQILNVQRRLLDQLYGDVVAQRVLLSASLQSHGLAPLGLNELYESLQKSIWAEAYSGKDIPLLRRNLQNEHLKRLSSQLLKPAAQTPADVISTQRMLAKGLSQQLAKAILSKKLGKEARAHLEYSRQALDEALKAPLLRAVP